MQTDKNARLRKGDSMKKNSLNEIDDGSTDDEVLMNTQEMLDEYSKLNDSSADPDYKPEEEEPMSEEISSDEVDTEEEKTESQKHLNGEK